MDCCIFAEIGQHAETKKDEIVSFLLDGGFEDLIDQFDVFINHQAFLSCLVEAHHIDEFEQESDEQPVHFMIRFRPYITVKGFS